jgi:RimJ/RimL family protein N-acetyltransferase
MPVYPEQEIRFSALRAGSITLHLITNENAHRVHSLFHIAHSSPEIIQELKSHYLPRLDSAGRQTMLGISSWSDLRGYTGADMLPHRRGKGITPACKPILFLLGFQLFGLNRIETGCSASNTSSRRSLEKTPGLVFEGLLRKYKFNPAIGEFADELRYAILREDWERLYSEVRVELILESSAP